MPKSRSTPQTAATVPTAPAAKAPARKRAAARSATRAQTARPPDIAVTVDLGNDFALQGQGITTRLTGEVDIRSSAVPGAPPRVTGEVRTDEGRYRAWGQMLDVETGLIRFNGPYNNPSLDILALRPNIGVRAGVQVTGSAQAPRVKLYSDPELPDAEKLSWVVLGRNATAGGAEAAVLQQAALALLGRKGGNTSTANIASRVGLDEIGFKGAAPGEDANTAALTFGKRISKDLYLTYERTLSGTLGAASARVIVAASVRRGRLLTRSARAIIAWSVALNACSEPVISCGSCRSTRPRRIRRPDTGRGRGARHMAVVLEDGATADAYAESIYLEESSDFTDADYDDDDNNGYDSRDANSNADADAGSCITVDPRSGW